MKYLLIIIMLLFSISCKDKVIVQEKQRVAKPIIPIEKTDRAKPKKVSTDSNKNETKKK